MNVGHTEKTALFYFLLFCMLGTTVLAQVQFDDRSYGSGKVLIKPESYFTKPIRIIDMPTSSILRAGDFRAGSRIYEQGGLLASLSAGVSNQVMFGVSYGGLNIIGDAQNIIWNPMPGVHFNYRITEESMKLPAIVAGFDSQGFGPYYKELEDVSLVPSDTLSGCPPQYPAPYHEKMFGRYQFKSRGFYLVVSKGYASFINAGLHAGVSYSLEKGTYKENKDDEKGIKEGLMPTIFMGADIHFARDLALLIEYDFAMHDSRIYSKGILNMGVRWAFGTNMFFDFDVQNFLGSTGAGETDMRRIIKLTYYGSILK